MFGFQWYVLQICEELAGKLSALLETDRSTCDKLDGNLTSDWWQYVWKEMVLRAAQHTDLSSIMLDFKFMVLGVTS